MTETELRKAQNLRPLTLGKAEDVRRYGHDVYYTRPILAGGEVIAAWCGYAANLPKLSRYTITDLVTTGGIHAR